MDKVTVVLSGILFCTDNSPIPLKIFKGISIVISVILGIYGWIDAFMSFLNFSCDSSCRDDNCSKCEYSGDFLIGFAVYSGFVVGFMGFFQLGFIIYKDNEMAPWITAIVMLPSSVIELVGKGVSLSYPESGKCDCRVYYKEEFTGEMGWAIAGIVIGGLGLLSAILIPGIKYLSKAKKKDSN